MWVATHPRGQIKAATDKNKATDGYYVQVVKLMKYWRDQLPTEPCKPKSYILESLVHRTIASPSSHAAGVVNVLEGIESSYGAHRGTGVVPSIPDPGYASVNVAKHWEPAEFNAFMNQVKAAAVTARKALDSKDEAESRKLWRQLFGSRSSVSDYEPAEDIRNRRQPPAGSLLSPEAMGGITASKGFGFQTRYAVCQLPVWLLDPAFHQLFHEGTGDIDIRFQEGERSSRIHVQVKDHNVAPAEFCEVVAQFQKRDAEFAGIYTCFTLVCPSLSENLQSIESGLARLRNAKPFYDDVAAAMAPTKVELDERMRSVGLAQDQIDFVHSKVKFDIVQGDLHHDDRASDVFIAQLLKHPEYKQMIRDAVQPAFAELLRSVDAKRGAVFGRADIEDVLRKSIVSVGSPERAITLWVQNWTSETFDIPADYVLDWSQEFDRNTRRVPTEDVWNNRLLPELKALRDRDRCRAQRAIDPVSRALRVIDKHRAWSHLSSRRRMGV